MQSSQISSEVFEVIKAARELADQIRIQYSGRWETYATAKEQNLIKAVEKLDNKLGDK